VDKFLQDFKYSLRSYRKAPGFTLTAVLTLAFGLGACTTVFSVINAILLKPLPYPSPQQIVIPWRQAPSGLNLGYDELPWGGIEYFLFLGESKTFQSLGAFQSESFNLTGSGDPARLEGLKASVGFFPSLGVTPALGRIFTSEDDQPGHQYEVILSDRLWHERFGADRSIIGRAVELNGYAYTVVGVMASGFVFPRAEEMPGSFQFPREPQLWVPLALSPEAKGPDELALVGRLRSGATIEQAQAEMNIFASRLESQYPRWKGWFNARVVPLAKQLAGDTRRPLLLMLAAVAVVLLIACSNVANLLLTRSLGRRKEFTLRAALGAGQRRLLDQLLIEGGMLAAAGGILGILFAGVGIHVVRVFGPANISRLQAVGLDSHVILFALALTFITGLFFGMAPAAGAIGQNLVDALKEDGARSGGALSHSNARKSILVGEVALAVVLVVAAGLLVRTFFKILRVDPGFSSARVLTFELSLPSSKYTSQESMVRLYRQILQQLQSVSGVESAALAEAVPMGGATESTVVRILNHPAANEKDKPFAAYTIVSPGYFATLGTPLLRGRDFLETDTADSSPVTIINNAMARKLWPGEDPIGTQIDFGNVKFPAMTVIGIVGDTKHASLREEPSPEMYVPYTQKPWPSMLTMQIAVRTRNDPGAMTGNVREAVHSVDCDLPLAKVASLMLLVDDSMAVARFSMLLVTAFGAFALLLASVGIYGVVSYSVMQRNREIGIRIALGARRPSVFAMILGQGARMAGLGILIGSVAAVIVARLLARFLYGISAIDPLTFLTVALLLLSVALLASYVPARRAMKVDPIVTLRYE
jgi:putative ABC transport system permease protein